MMRRGRGAGWVWLAWATAVWAGGGPQNVLVVVNDSSAESRTLGRYYVEQRGLHDRQVLHVNLSTNYTVDSASFSNALLNPMQAYLQAAGLSNQVDLIVLTRGMPYKVSQGASTNSITSALFYGFKTNAAAPCSAPYPATRSDYYDAERSFRRSDAPSSNRYYLAAFLTATNLDGARRVVDHALAADATQPTGQVDLLWTPDPRNIQWPDFEDAAFAARFTAAPETYRFLEGYTFYVGGQTQVMGMSVGQCCSVQIGNNQLVPGALAEHLTSYGGTLYEPSGQDSVLGWLDHGAVGSYGTVVEPCAATSKFPHVRYHYWYGRGFNMAECFYMAVRNPYEGVVVGDPLAAAYAASPGLGLGGVTSGQVVSGVVNLQVTGTAAAASAPVRRLDFYVDGLFQTNLLALSPRQGNQVTFGYNGSNRTYTVPAAADVFTVATGLAALVNQAPTRGLRAQAHGDRVEIVQTNLGVAGATNTVAVQTAQGSATQLTLTAWSPFPHLLETVYAAREQIQLTNVPLPGDRVRALITRLDGHVVTNEVTATASETSAYLLLSNLVTAMNADTNLQGVEGCSARYFMDFAPFGSQSAEAWLEARTNTWEGGNLFVNFQVIPTNGSSLGGPDFTDNFNDNGAGLRARAQLFVAAGLATAVVAHALDTATLPDGPHDLMVALEDGTGVAAQRRVTIPVTVDNNSITCAVVRPLGGQHFAQGAALTVEVAAATGAGVVTQVSLWVEGKAFAATAAPPYVWIWATTNYGPGAISVQAQAFDDAGRSALSAAPRVVLDTDEDGDGVSDAWEFQYLGSATNYNGTADPDGDGVNNRDEYLADTHPTNGQSRLRIETLLQTNGSLALGFPARTTRLYRVGLHDGALGGGGSWLPASNGYFAAGGDVVQWADHPTNAPVTTNAARFYRVEAAVP